MADMHNVMGFVFFCDKGTLKEPGGGSGGVDGTWWEDNSQNVQQGRWMDSLE